MTTTTQTTTARCGISPDCYHPICDCGAIIRLSRHRLHEHPGTVKGYLRERICDHCKYHAPAKVMRNGRKGGSQMSEHDKQRLAHLESLPTTDDRLQYWVPEFYRYLEERRTGGGGRRGQKVPAEGYLFPDEIQELRGQKR